MAKQKIRSSGERAKLRLVESGTSATPDAKPGVFLEALWSMASLRTEAGVLGRADGVPVIERRGGRSQPISFGAMEALVAHLTPHEAFTVRLSVTQENNGVLEAYVSAHGATKALATARRAALNSCVATVFKTILPHVDMVEGTGKAKVAPLPFQATLRPAGEVVPILSTPKRGTPRPASQYNPDVIEFPATLSPSDLSFMMTHIDALGCDVVLELSLSPETLDPGDLEDIDEAIEGVRARRMHDAESAYLRDDRSSAALTHLQNLAIERRVLLLTVRVYSSRALTGLELSMLSSAIFGSPHVHERRSAVPALASFYPKEAAILTTVGFALASVGPCQERRDVSELARLDGLNIGKTAGGQAVRMTVENPRNHTYTIGRSGAGKSTLMINMILQDAADGRAVVVIDPHGDLCDDLYMRMPEERLKDVIYFHCADPNSFPLMNPMERRSGVPEAEENSRIVDNLKRLVRRVLYPGFDPDAFGPIYEDLVQAGFYLLLEACGDEARISDFERVWTDAGWRRELLRRPSVSAETKRKVGKIQDVDDGWHKIDNLVPYVTSKFTVFSQNQLLKPIVDGRDLSGDQVVAHQLDFDKVLREKKIILLNLAVTQMGETASTLLGGLATMKLYDAAKRQPRDAKNERPSAAVYLDEFATYATEILADMMAETRKFGLRITLANQTLNQIRGRGRDHLHAILGNAGNLVLFGVDTEDAIYLSQRFPGMLAPSELASLANYEAICRFQTKSKAYGPLRVRTEPAPPILRPTIERDI